MIAMVMFGLTIAQAKGVKTAILKTYIDEIAKLPKEISRVLKEVDEPIKKMVKQYY